jgi:PKD repeat protein
MSDQDCECCEGTQILTPVNTANRPGLSALRYRVGTHASFLETMKARLSNMPVELPLLDDPNRLSLAFPLRSLATRAPDDASIALLDAWATVGDVLTFYQERIANEGYLRTATERRSVLELARLIGYVLRPGVAATAFLALDLDKGYEIEIPPHAIKAQSIPSTPKEFPQIFENDETLDARASWNQIEARKTRPQTSASIAKRTDKNGYVSIYIKGTKANLKPNDVLLLMTEDGPQILRVAEYKPDPANDRALVIFQPDVQKSFNASAAIAAAEAHMAKKPRTGRNKVRTAMASRVVQHLQGLVDQMKTAGSATSAQSIINETALRISEELDAARREQHSQLAEWLAGILSDLQDKSQSLAASAASNATFVGIETPAAVSTKPGIFEPPEDPLDRVISRLTRPASIPPRNSISLDRKLANTFSTKADIGLQIASLLDVKLQRTLPVTLTGVKVTADPDLQLYVFRSVARPFGHNALPRPDHLDRGITVTGEWEIDNPMNVRTPIAAFQVDPLGGTVATTFSFTNRSSGEIVSYRWDFGDGTSTTVDENPTHQYANASKNAKEFTVTLTVNGPPVNGVPTSDSAKALITVTDTSPGVVIKALMAATPSAATPAMPIPPHQTPDQLFLDSEYKIQSTGGWVVVEGPDTPDHRLILNMNTEIPDAQVFQQSLAAYGMSGKTTLLKLQNNKTWIKDGSGFSAVRSTVVHAESEELLLADEPIDTPICNGTDTFIELDELYTGMKSGRWVIISGERADILDPTTQQPIRGVKASELAMLAEVIQTSSTEEGQPLPENPKRTDPPAIAGDRTHTWIRLAKALEYCYLRDTVRIYGNVLKASHGETRKETLGSGDASQAFQSFTLKQSPLTFISSPTPVGAVSTLAVYVNDVRWKEADSLDTLAPTDREFVTKTDDSDKTTVIFGNGQHGARLPTGPANIRAEYRNGIGRPGNVQAGQISLLAAKPLGVRTVSNPMRASGGADRESMDTARKNAPLTVTALDRLVSVADYADFTRTFAGIGKSLAAQLSDGRRQVVHVTIAGADDIPIDKTSDLYKNLLLALRNAGDANVPVILQVRELLILVLSANIQILPDYQWEPVAKAVRARLLDIFSFERRDLAQDVMLSEVIAAIQAVPGVAYVDVDKLGGVPEKTSDIVEGVPARRLRTPQEISKAVQSLVSNGTIDPNEPAKAQPLQRVLVDLASVDRKGLMIPAQLAYFLPDVPDTLVLNQIGSL